MKKIFGLLTLLLFIGCFTSIDLHKRRDNFVYFVNKVNSNFFIFIDIEIEKLEPIDFKCSGCFNKISKHDAFFKGPEPFCAKEYLAAYNIDSLSIFLIKEEDFLKFGLDSIIEHKIYTELKFTSEEMQKCNCTIVIDSTTINHFNY